jgi:hypothetical protein
MLAHFLQLLKFGQVLKTNSSLLLAHPTQECWDLYTPSRHICANFRVAGRGPLHIYRILLLCSSSSGVAVRGPLGGCHSWPLLPGDGLLLKAAARALVATYACGYEGDADV